MSDYAFRSELAPPLIVCKQHETLPAANTDLHTPITIVGDSGGTRCGAFEIYFSSPVGGTLKLKRVIGELTEYETLNFGQAVTAGVPAGPQIVTFATGETLSVIYSGESDTYYLTIADVSGDSVRQVKC